MPVFVLVQAGMTSEDHPERLMIALEPEAASIYVRKLRLYQLVPDNSATQTLGRGSGASTRSNRYSYYAPDTAGNLISCCGFCTAHMYCLVTEAHFQYI